uniref:Ig-like domain-containing protein n=1 Tax=Poecilia formosa TaxID=48698 RepID=A0A087X9L6_POEFO
SNCQCSLLVYLFLFIFVSCSNQTIRAEPGQTIILPCEAARNKNELTVDWSKPDLGENDHVALYRNDQFDDEGQNPSYKDRVDLQDREIKNRDVSLVLKNVTTDDTGKYECRVHPSNRRKRSYLDNEPICIITLQVSAAGE